MPRKKSASKKSRKASDTWPVPKPKTFRQLMQELADLTNHDVEVKGATAVFTPIRIRPRKRSK